jgi:hypothetical protein
MPSKKKEMSPEEKAAKEAAKAAEKAAKACTDLLKACKDDNLPKAEKALRDGADINFANERGQTAAHIAAAYGALKIIRLCHASGADFSLETSDKNKFTPIAAARHIGEEDSALLIEALLAGKSGDDIGLGKDLDMSDDDADDGGAAKTKEATPSASAEAGASAGGDASGAAKAGEDGAGAAAAVAVQ